MSASKLFPKTYKGRVESGGYIYKNSAAKSASAPEFKGKVYVAEPGWYWVSVWRRGKTGVVPISFDPMTDEQVMKYHAPKEGRTRISNGYDAPQQTTLESQPGDDSDIPF